MIKMNRFKSAALCVVTSSYIIGIAPQALAHGVIGQRFFPATITTDDPFAADELALPTITSFDHETDFDFDY